MSEGGRRYELLVTGKDEIGGLSKLTARLANRGVDLSLSGGYYIVAPGTFVWTTFANFDKSRASLETVIKDLRGLGFVTEVEAVEMGKVAFDQFLFPLVIMNGFRGVIMNMGPLLRVEQRLTEQFGSGGAVLMFEEGKQYALESVSQVREALPESSPEELLNAVVAWLRTTGWGIFAFDVSQFEDAGKVKVTIVEPPNAAVRGVDQSHFANGTTAGIIESVFGMRVRLAHSSYEESEKTLMLAFESS